MESDGRRFFAEASRTAETGRRFCFGGAGRPGGEGLCSLRRRGTPGSDDDAGGIVCDGVGNRRGHGPDRNAKAGGGLRGRICRERAAISGVAGCERAEEFGLTIGLEWGGNMRSVLRKFSVR